MLLLLLAACSKEVEGDEAGECSDGADNDWDGYFDCQDNECWNSPDCEGEGGEGDADTDTDTDGDGDADADSDTDTDVDNLGEGLDSVEVLYTLHWDFILEPKGVTDCVQTYVGEGTQVEAVGERVTFEGTWQMTETDCAEALNTSIWTPGGDHAAYTSFVLLGSGEADAVDTWMVHSASDGHTTEDAEFWIAEMAASLSGDSAAHEEDEEIPEAYLVLTHELEMHFNP